MVMTPRQRCAAGYQADAADERKRGGRGRITHHFSGKAVFRREVERITLHPTACLQANERTLAATEIVGDDEVGVVAEGDAQRIACTGGA